MKATHTDYLHPKHLRVVDGNKHMGWNATVGFFETDAVCVSPSCSYYAKLNKPNLPKWNGA